MTQATVARPISPNDDSPTDDELAQAALQDPECFSMLYTRYVQRVYNYLYGKVGQAAEAEDLTAQVFTEVVEGLPRYRPQGSFAAWLFTIARRRAANWFRARRPSLPLEAAESRLEAQPDLLKEVIREEELGRLRRHLQALKEDDLELLRLRFAAGLTYLQIAGILGKTESAVGVCMHRLEAGWEADNG